MLGFPLTAASPSDKAVDPPPGSLYADTSAGETPTGLIQICTVLFSCRVCSTQGFVIMT